MNKLTKEEILKFKVLICSGAKRDEMAEKLNITRSAIDKRMTKLFDTYGVTNLASLVKELMAERFL